MYLFPPTSCVRLCCWYTSGDSASHCSKVTSQTSSGMLSHCNLCIVRVVYIVDIVPRPNPSTKLVPDMLSRIRIWHVERPRQHVDVISMKELLRAVHLISPCIVVDKNDRCMSLRNWDCLGPKNMNEVAFRVKISLSDDDIGFFSVLIIALHPPHKISLSNTQQFLKPFPSFKNLENDHHD